MRRRLKFLLAYLFFWLVFFIIFKAIFLVYQGSQTFQLSPALIAGIFWYGLKMDLSFSAYLSLIPFLLVAISVFVPPKLISGIIKGYTIIVVPVISLLCVTDLEIFKAWGFRLDSTPMMYIDNPREMVASAGASPIFILLSILFGTIVLASFAFIKKIQPILKYANKVPWFSIPLFLLIPGILIIPIRGGLQLAPINQSVAYFSTNNYANQAAINVPWNFFNTLGRGTYDQKNPYNYLEKATAGNLVHALYENKNYDKGPGILKSSRPNILIILWESFTAKTSLLYGRDNITPAFSNLTKEGILFSNFYASADRSDKGIVAVLSGYPAQPAHSIIKIPNKAAKLPSLANDFKNNGYHTSFYYGGEPEFANIKSYLVNAGFEKIVSKDDFDKKDWNSKWGTHDHVLFDRVFEELNEQQKPFFTTVFTLSSHEPYEIPTTPLLAGDDEETLFLNSLHYTDQSIGDFIQKIKAEPWYDNTLVVILADHGHRLPGDSRRHEAAKFHTPMLWLGGALKVSDTTINKVAAQTDFPKTLLNQMDMNVRDYKWSKDIFNPNITPFAQYVFNDGIGFVNEDGYLAFDNTGKQLIHKDEGLDGQDLKKAKAHLQVSYQDFLEK